MYNLPDDLNTSPEAVASGVIFYERRKDKKLFTCPRGRVFFKPVQTRPLIALVHLAAEHLGFRLPVPSFIERAELLYRNDTLTEVRACGKYVAGLDRSDKPVLRKWHTPVEPKFSLDHGLDLRPGLRDINKSYIAVLNKRQGAVVWWDLSSQYRRKVFAEGDNRHRFKLLVRREAPRSEIADLFPEAVDTAEVRESVKGLGPEALYRALMPHVPSDSSELLAVKISDPHRILIYLVDKTYVEYQLAARHALKQGCDEKVLADLAYARGLSREQAKVLWARTRLTEQAVLVRECVETVHEKTYQTLRDTFDTIVGDNVYEAVLADWTPLSDGRAQNAEVIKISLLKKEQDERKKQLGLRRPGRPSRALTECEKMMEERKGRIVRAMMTIRRSVKNAGAREDDVEDLITPSAVATELKVSVSTLYRWLHDCALRFESVRDNILTRPRSRR